MKALGVVTCRTECGSEYGFSSGDDFDVFARNLCGKRVTEMQVIEYLSDHELQALAYIQSRMKTPYFYVSKV